LCAQDYPTPRILFVLDPTTQTASIKIKHGILTADREYVKQLTGIVGALRRPVTPAQQMLRVPL
jgi:hypothetical protein